MRMGADIRMNPARDRRASRWPGRLRRLDRRHARIAAVVLSALVAVLGMRALLAPGRFPVRSVRIVGNLGRIPQPLLVAAVRPFLYRNFYALPLATVGAAVAQVPWVGSVRVERRFPRALVIYVGRLRLAARWARGGWVDTQGGHAHLGGYRVPAGLPVFQGPPGSEQEMWSHYGRFAALLKPAGLAIAALDLSDRGTWRVALRGGPRLVLGHEASVRLARFMAVFPQLAGKWPAMRQVDLRYTNGFAVGWKTGRGIKQ